MSQQNNPFLPSPAYRIFLTHLITTRLNRGFSQTELAGYLNLAPQQIAAFENGEMPLGFIDVRNWLLALDMPFVEFTTQMEEVLDSTLIYDETITPPTDPTFMPTESSPTASIPTIQVLFFAPDTAPEVRTIENTLEAMQGLVGGLITTFETGITGTIGIANDEALVHDMDLNRHIPATGAHIFGPFFVAGDAPPGFRSLTPRELELALDHLAPEVPQSAFTALMRTLDGGRQWIENWE